MIVCRYMEVKEAVLSLSLASLAVAECTDTAYALYAEVCRTLSSKPLRLESHAGSKSDAVQASALQVALAGLGLDEQQLRRVAAALVTQLQQHTARQESVSLQVQLVDCFHMPYLPHLSHIHMLFKACTTSKHIGLQQIQVALCCFTVLCLK